MKDVKVSDVLKNLDRHPFKWFFTRGVCYYMATKAPAKTYMMWHANIVAATTSWPKGTGNVFFPVPSTNIFKCNASMFNTTNFKWNPLTKYGRLRQEYLAHLIKWFSERGM